jgi:cytochrome o ubiquinol oxidase subunit 2
VMNSFFIPALAGQIYAMPGMETQLHAVINKPGQFDGLSANFSGDGFSHMNFVFHGLSDGDFAQWVQKAKAGGGELSRDEYVKLAQPSEQVPVHYWQLSAIACRPAASAWTARRRLRAVKKGRRLPVTK